jgi:hypothetical protein
MPRYNKGDELIVDGRKVILRSNWPADDSGPFTTTHRSKDGGEVWQTHYAGHVELDGEPLYSSADVELSQANNLPEMSTLGDIPTEPTEAEVTEIVDAQAESTSKRAAK